MAFVFNVMFSYGQNTDSIKISIESAFNYDRCNMEDGKIRSPYDTTLTHSDSTQCFSGYVMATNKSGIFYIVEIGFTSESVSRGYVIAVKYPRKFLGIRLKPKRCCYRKSGTWKLYNYDPQTNHETLIEEINYEKNGPVVLDNLKIQYSDLQKFYRDPAERSIDN